MFGMDERFSALVFSTFDKSGDGFIDQREFLASMAVMLHPYDVEQQVSQAFDAYDLNKDGKLQVLGKFLQKHVLGKGSIQACK